MVAEFFAIVKRNDLLIFVNESLNTSSFYAGYISDFGAFGAFLIVALIQSIWAWFFISAIKRKNVSEILAYSIVLQCVIFSVFYDLFLLLPYLFQILLTRLYGKKIKWSKA
jgi:oligosaccharide repeat unit polymerase